MHRFLRKHKTTVKLLKILALCLALLICWKVGREIDSKYLDRAIDSDVDVQSFDVSFGYLEITELDGKTMSENAIEVNLDDAGSELVIEKEGDYVLTGVMLGRIIIRAKEQNVHLFLNNATIVSQGGPAILVPDNSGDKLVITIMDGTGNAISDNGDFRHYSDYNAAIDASCDITINGTGALIVNGYYEDAIHSKDIVKILDGTYSITSKRNGIMGNDGVLVSGGTITMESEKNGIKTLKKGLNGRGNLVIDGGTLSVIAGRYSFVTAKADIYIYNCSVYSNSVVDIYDCGGEKIIQEGCIQ